MNLKEIVDGGSYSIFRRMGPENRTNHIMVVNYIENLVASSNANVSDWNMMELFGTGEGNNLIQDKRKINSIFFEELKSREGAIQHSVTNAVTDAIQKKLSDYGRHILQQQLLNIQQNRDSFLSQARDYYRSAENYIKSAFQKELEMRTMGGRNIDINKQITEINAARFWTFTGFSDPLLTFVTTNDVICRHINKQSKIDIQVNFGRFKATLNLQNMELRVLGFENNIPQARDNHQCLHPHVLDGRICWGNAQDSALKKLSMGELVEPFALLASLLTSYNEQSPYRHIQSFKEEYDRMAASRPPRPEPAEQAPAAQAVTPAEEAEFHEDEPEYEPEFDENGDRL